MAKALRTFTIPTNDSGDTVKIEIEELALTAENLGLTTWGSSFVLATCLHRFKIDLASFLPATSTTPKNPGITVLELGAGTGLVGLSAAAIWHTNVILSDLAPIVPGLATNITANEEILSLVGGSASCGTLDWANPNELVLRSTSSAERGQQQQQQAFFSETDKAMIILAADTVYSEEHPAILSKAILTWLRSEPHARAIITYPMRVAYLDEIRELWELLQRGGLEAIDEGREMTSHDWDDEALHEWSIWRWRTADGTQ